MMDPRPAVLKSPLQELCFQFTVCMAQFLSQGSVSMSLSTMNIVFDSFNERLGGTLQSSEKVWFMGSYALTLGTFILISGRMGDLFGLRKILLIGWAWNAVWLLITGLSYYANLSIFFIVCRAFQGIGFALVIPCAVGILGTAYPNGKRKNMSFACFGASAPIGATIGGIMAALVAQEWWWPWAFFLLAIVCTLLGLLSLYAIPGPFKHHDYTFKEAIARFDLTGLFLGVASLILFNFVWNQGPVVGWGLAYVIVLLVVSIVMMVAFFWVELHWATYPLLPKAVFKVRIGLVLLCISLGWGLFGIWQYYYWSLVMNLRGYLAVTTALTYLPLLVMGMVAALTVGFVISPKTAPFIVFCSMVGFMLGLVILLIVPVDQTFWQLTFAQMFFLCWGMDCSFPAASLILSDYLPLNHQGMAGLLVNTMVNYSVSLYLAVSSSAEIEVFNRNGNTLLSYRAAIYVGVGVAALAVVAAVGYIIIETTQGEPVVCDSEAVSLEDESAKS